MKKKYIVSTVITIFFGLIIFLMKFNSLQTAEGTGYGIFHNIKKEDGHTSFLVVPEGTKQDKSTVYTKISKIPKEYKPLLFKPKIPDLDFREFRITKEEQYTRYLESYAKPGTKNIISFVTYEQKTDFDIDDIIPEEYEYLYAAQLEGIGLDVYTATIEGIAKQYYIYTYGDRAYEVSGSLDTVTLEYYLSDFINTVVKR